MHKYLIMVQESVRMARDSLSDDTDNSLNYVELSLMENWGSGQKCQELHDKPIQEI